MSIKGKKVAIMATDYFEEAELTEPLKFLEDAGATIDVIAPHDGEIQGLKHADPGQSVPVDLTLDQANPGDYDAAVFPGGALNADKLRMDKSAREFMKYMMNAEKPVAVICHAPWIIVSAGLAPDKQMTSYYTIQDDIRNAGGEWIDQEVVVDGNLITSRKPDDIPAFNQALMEALTDKEEE